LKIFHVNKGAVALVDQINRAKPLFYA